MDFTPNAPHVPEEIETDAPSELDRLRSALEDQHASTDALWNENTALRAQLAEAREEISQLKTPPGPPEVLHAAAALCLDPNGQILMRAQIYTEKKLQEARAWASAWKQAAKKFFNQRNEAQSAFVTSRLLEALHAAGARHEIEKVIKQRDDVAATLTRLREQAGALAENARTVLTLGGSSSTGPLREYIRKLSDELTAALGGEE